MFSPRGSAQCVQIYRTMRSLVWALLALSLLLASTSARAESEARIVGPGTAEPLADDLVTVEASLSFPPRLSLAGAVGLRGPFEIEAGLHLSEQQGALNLSEFSLAAKVGYQLVPQLSLGARLESTLGANFDDSWSTRSKLRILATTHISNSLAFTLGLASEFIFEQCRDCTLEEEALGRFRTDITALYALTDRLSAFATLDYRVSGRERILAQNSLFGQISADPRLYGQLGVRWVAGSL